MVSPKHGAVGRHRHKSARRARQLRIESHERIRLKLGERYIFGSERIWPVKLVGEVPSEFLEHPIAEQANVQRPHMVELSAGLVPVDLTAPGRGVQRRQRLGPKKRRSEERHRVVGYGALTKKPERCVEGDHKTHGRATLARCPRQEKKVRPKRRLGHGVFAGFGLHGKQGRTPRPS